MNGYTDTENTTLLRDFNVNHSNHCWSPFLCDGPSHMPTFKIFLYVNNTRFEGCGSSKKRAKINAIKKFTSPNLRNGKSNSAVYDVMENQKRKCIEIENMVEQPPLKKLVVDSNNLIAPQTSAVSILHEIFAGQSFVYEHEDSHGILEAISVCVSGQKYIGYGKNKKEAKDIACRNALKAISEEQPIDRKFKDQIEMFRTDYYEGKIIDHFAYITDTMYQKLEFNNHKNKEYSVIASIIKVN